MENNYSIQSLNENFILFMNLCLTLELKGMHLDRDFNVGLLVNNVVQKMRGRVTYTISLHNFKLVLSFLHTKHIF